MTELEHNTRRQMLNDLASSNQPANRGSMALLFGVTVGRRSACQPVEPTNPDYSRHGVKEVVSVD